MNDIYSFFRYILPGAVFIFELGLSLAILFPDSVHKTLDSSVAKNPHFLNAAVALILGTFTAIALGYLFTVFFRFPALFLIDYSRFVLKLSKLHYIEKCSLILRMKKEKCIKRRKTAWIIVSSIWFERSESSPRIKGATARTQSLSNILNSSAANTIGTFIAIIIVIETVACNWSSTSLSRVIVVTFLLGLAFAAQLDSCLDAKKTLQEFCEIIITNTLADEHKAKKQTLDLSKIKISILSAMKWPWLP
ncbi:hypothetical protein [Turneriella parva]|uniref:Uncharacterized protein n=1 Tax=Turneriella parva (strain ATCC BAA-1111 / DSM 21527 / NCTC 11395 / H) TaxID=869212 RepID=I4B510_TURPD|nr:hypothetical protein [Turneriella parva]AFM12367.1 hypothetical protein Turpa_1719 [Turneriella parva DSM 21527]